MLNVNGDAFYGLDGTGAFFHKYCILVVISIELYTHIIFPCLPMEDKGMFLHAVL